MDVFGSLEKTYSEIDQRFAQMEFEAASRGWIRKEALYASYRTQNDQAYFLYFFTRLEDHITTEAKRVIDRGLNLQTWKRRSPWRELKNINDRGRLAFMAKVGLLAEPGGSDFNLINAYYTDRNVIAHGGSATISMPNVISDMKLLYKRVRDR
jgi:hypothetical protein